MVLFRKALICTVGLLFLPACANTPAPVDVRLVCPAVRQYSPEQDSAILTAYKALPVGSPLREVMMDYKALRDGLRACSDAAEKKTLNGH